MESIIIRHPWLDGNKRTGLELALLLLRKEGLRVEASQDELYDLTIAVAEGRMSAEKIHAWLEPKLRPAPKLSSIIPRIRLATHASPLL